MNDALKMQISAFVDGELPDNETELLLRRLSQDAELRDQVAHYLAMGRMIRREPQVPKIASLRSRILAELGEEPAEHAATEAPAEPRLLRPIVGFAVAASVALLAIVGLQRTDPVDQNEPVEAAPVAGITVPEIDDELLEMHRRHSRSASDLGSSDVLSRFVTFELQGRELVEVTPEMTADEEQDDEEKQQEGGDESTQSIDSAQDL